MKLGLITWHYYGNFGSMLQSYALLRVLKDLGHQAEIINYRNIKFGKYSRFKNAMKLLIDGICRNYSGNEKPQVSFRFITFEHKYLQESKVVTSKQELTELGHSYECIVCGSDQIWAPNVFNPVYMIDFVEGDKVKKISYAASIGLNEIPQDLIATYRTLLQDFSGISVREETGKELLHGQCGIETEVVLDPTLLHSADEYRKLQCKVKTAGKYVFCYFLNKNHAYHNRIRSYAVKHNLAIVGWSACSLDSQWMNCVKWIGPCEFLWLIDNAEAVFTDSYHGTIFSMLFHKNFFTFERFKSTDAICQNSRIHQLDVDFDLSQRIISPNDECIDITDTFYSKFETQLHDLRQSSMKYLKEKLKNDVVIHKE